MRRCITFVFVMVVIGGVGGTLAPNAHAAEQNRWMTHPIVKVYEGRDNQYIGEQNPCGGKELPIVLKGATSQTRGCVFGKEGGVRLARYKAESGRFAYAISYPNDVLFTYVEGLCDNLARCVYGQAGDLLLLEGDALPLPRYTVVKNFTQHIVPAESGPNAYRFIPPHPIRNLKLGNQYFQAVSTTVSGDGRWIFLEDFLHGILLMDAKTAEYRRIAERGTLPYYSGAIVSMAASDDGKWLASVGHTSGALIYKITDTCGEGITPMTPTFFLDDAQKCEFTYASASTLFTNASGAYAPRFSSDNKRLTVYRRDGVPYKTVITAAPVGDGNPHYVAFGDSFTSGEGEVSDAFYLPGTNTAANRCHVSTRSYPYLLQNSWEIIATNKACSGSRIEGVRGANRAFLASREGYPASVVSLSIGGNDADFMGKLKSCLGPGTCQWAQPKYRKAVAEEIKGLFPRIVELITELKQDYESAKLFVVGYPNVINGGEGAACGAMVLLLNQEERRYMSESISYLNQVMKAAADYTKTPFADIEHAYSGERLCDNKTTAMNAVRYGDDMAPIPLLDKVKLIGAESFHPTPRGHQLGAAAIQSSLASSFWSSMDCEACNFQESDLAPSSYWGEGGTENQASRRLISKEFLANTTYQPNEPAFFTFLRGVFKPHTLIRFELHSDIKEMGEVTADEMGAATGKLTLPDDVEGYHTMHVYGTSYSGDEIELYQTVYIGEVPEETPSLTNPTESNKQPSSNSKALLAHVYEPPVDEGRDETTQSDTTSQALEVKGTHTIPPRPPLLPNASREEVKLQPWWLGAGVILCCTAFLIRFILKKPKL